MSDKEVVNTTYPSLRAYKIQSDINSSDQQIRDINEKLLSIQHRERIYTKNTALGLVTAKDYRQHLEDLKYKYIYIQEIDRKRKSISRKKNELAKIIGQEIADLSLTWDNAAIGIEDLSFVANTTNNRRWNFGEIHKWIQHYANVQGLVCLKVTAWKSSHECSSCGSFHTVMRNKERLLHCLDCSTVVDRDVSASIVLAKRLVSKAGSSHKTRETKRRKYNIPPTANTEEDGFVVRVPSRKETNAPKKNRDKSSPTPKRVLKKQEVDSYCQELFLEALHRKEVESFVSPTQRGRGSIDTIVKLDSHQHTFRLVDVELSSIVRVL